MLQARLSPHKPTDQSPYVARISWAARSPMITQVAMVLPVVMRGMIDASAMRRLSMPYTWSLPLTTDNSSQPIFAVQAWCQKADTASRAKSSSAAPFRFPHSARQPNLGRGSTYRSGKSVQTTGTTSLSVRKLHADQTEIIPGDAVNRRQWSLNPLRQAVIYSPAAL